MKLVALLLLCSVLCLSPGNCSRDRITISQFLSFLHKISELCDELRKKYKSDQLVPFKFAYVYKTYNVAHLYRGLPATYRDWLRQFHVDPKPTTPPSTPITSTMDTSTESMSSTIDTTETESTETSSKETSTTEGTTGKSTTDEPTTESSTEDMVTQSSTEETSTESSSSEVTSTSSSSIETSSTDKEMESKTTSSETDSTMCTLEASTMPVERHIVFKRAVRANNNEEEDARRVVNVLNEVTDFASKWALPISAFKSKLQYFEKNLVNGRFPSKFFERVRGRLLAFPIRKATPKLQANIRRIRGRISNYMVEATDATDLENIDILMKAIYELPQVLIQSLVG